MGKPGIQSSLSSTQNIRRAIWLVSAALVVGLMAFAGYYVWDRYIHLEDRSPIEAGIEEMERAIRQEPQNPEMRLALAETYLAAGQYEGAFDQADQVLDLYPENAGALLIAGMASARLDQPDAALDPLTRFVALRKDEPMANTDQTLEAAYYFLGESYVKLGRPAEALPVLEAALAIDRTDADALFQAGLAYQASGQPETALERYHKAVRLVPDFAEAYQGMVESYSATGQPHLVAYARGMEAYSLREYETALPHLEQASMALPDFGPAFLGLGLAYERTGRLDEALAAIQRALELEPNDFATQQALGRLQAATGSQN